MSKHQKIQQSRLINFEGIDYCGKSTQIDLLVNRLKGDGYDVELYRDPGATAISEEIRSILLNAKNTDMSDLTELMLYEAARTQMVHELILPGLQSGKIIILDRYYDSTTAYQGFGRGINLEVIRTLNKIAVRNAVPDLTFYLKISLDTFSERKEKHNEAADRLETAGLDFFKKVIKGYGELAKTEPERIKTIDAEQDIQSVHENIWISLKKII